MAPLVKDGPATLEQGLDLARRREFDRASEKFMDASRKLLKEGSVLESNRARAYAELFSQGVRGANPAVLVGLGAFLRSALGDDELKPGPRSIRAVDLATQLELTARDTNLMIALQTGAATGEGLAKAMQGLASDYGQLGDGMLFLPELFEQRTIPAASRVPILMALSFETLGTSVQGTDPLAAAEHFQTAQQYWVQAGDDNRSQAASAKVGHLALQAKCWVCGREGTGHGIQFVSLPIDQGVEGLKGGDSSPLPSLDRSGRLVYVCKGCYSAVYGLADRLAIQRSAETERRLLAEIRAMEQRLYSIVQRR